MASAFGDASFTFETNPAYHFEMNDKVHIDGQGFGWLVVLRLNVPVNNFSVISGQSHRFQGN